MKTTLTKLTLIMTVAFLTSCSGLRYPESYLTKAPKKKVETAQKEELKSIQQIDQNQIASTKSEKGIIDDQQVRKETEKTESAIMEKPSVQKKSSAFEKKAQRIEKKLNSIDQKIN
jgi:hypothetical protein